MHDALIADLTGSKGTIRSLINQELPLLRDHLLRLDAESRRDRFNGYADELFIDRYAQKCGGDGTIIIAFVGEDGAVHAAAELHQPDLSTDSLPEIAFSVEAHLRRKGIGSILFRQLMEVARSLCYERVRITTGAVMPEGCDSVVVQEVVRQETESQETESQETRQQHQPAGTRIWVPAGQGAGQNRRLAGEDERFVDGAEQRGQEILADPGEAVGIIALRVRRCALDRGAKIGRRRQRIANQVITIKRPRERMAFTDEGHDHEIT